MDIWMVNEKKIFFFSYSLCVFLLLPPPFVKVTGKRRGEKNEDISQGWTSDLQKVRFLTTEKRI